MVIYDGIDPTGRGEVDDLARCLVGTVEVEREETAWLRLLEDVRPFRGHDDLHVEPPGRPEEGRDRKSTRLNSSHRL